MASFTRRMCLVAGMGLGACQVASSTPQAEFAHEHRRFLDRHCLACHGPDREEGRFRADQLPFTITTIETAETWQKVLDASSTLARCLRRM